jgi:PadR family transcriptional regulator, regulatory protein PadR
MINQKEIQTKLTKGLLDPIILQILDNHPMHGYELLTTIRKTYGISFAVSSIYPLLNLMEKKKYLKSNWNMDSERPKKIYELTADGKALLNFTSNSLITISKAMTKDKIKQNNNLLQQHCR